MSQDPKSAIDRCRQYEASCGLAATPGPGDVRHVLAILDHQAAQIEALRRLVKPAPLPAPPTPAESVCQEAERITGGERQANYGPPIFDFTRTARIWEVILDRPAGAITPEQIGLCMIGVKIARYLHKPQRDSLVDIAGYAKTVQMCADYEPDGLVDESS
jgi:hypothetical protein